MIKEAADTITKLKTILDEIRSGATDANTGQRSINSNFWVNGLDKTPEIAKAEAAFVRAAEAMTAGGDVFIYALKDEASKEWEYGAALAALRNYSASLRDARGRPDARSMGTIDETQVDEPIF
jgi:hypothetical protein